jgi:hypothetical protein
MDEIELHKLGAERDYERWRMLWRNGEYTIANERSRIINYYARKAYIAELERKVMGQEKNQLAQRIGRQRAANSKQRRRIQELELHLKKAQEEIRGLRRELGAHTATERNRVAGLIQRETGFRPWNKESSTSPGFDSTTEHGTGETPTDREG